MSLIKMPFHVFGLSIIDPPPFNPEVKGKEKGKPN